MRAYLHPFVRISVVVLVVVLTGLIMAGCFDHAGRSHPFDPRSEDFEREGAISGLVSELYAPFSPLVGVEVRIKELDSLNVNASSNFSVVLTNKDGFFFFNLTAGRYAFSVEKDKYAAFQDTLVIQAGSVEEVNVMLDGLPYADFFHLSAIHTSQWWPPPLELYMLEVKAEVDDVDGVTDVNRVWLEVPELNWADTLNETSNPGTFIKIVDESDLPVDNITNLLGRAVTLHVRDRAGVENSSTPQFLVRIIDPTPNPKEPAGLLLLSNPTPRLIWEPMLLSYHFTYRIDVVRVQANVQTVEQTIEHINSDSLSITVPEPLSSGEYFWTVSVVDDFGNRSRSREAGFRIE